MSGKMYEPRHVYLAIGLCILVFSPILLAFVSQTVAQLLHYTNNSWYVFTPIENYFVYGLGFLFIFLATLVIFFINNRKLSIVLSIGCILFSIFCFGIASQSYKELADESISYSPLLSLKDYTYSWDDVDSIEYTIDHDKDKSQYKITFSDSNYVELRNDNYFKAVSYKFFNKMRDIQVLLETVEEPI